jgi:CHAT domain-containing protein/tetratricopeptide (TPR) repeat protein
MFERRARRGAILVSAGAVILCNAAGPGSAATHDQIVGACREAARPTMVACMQGKRGQGEHDALLEQCRQSVGIPFVKACVSREEQKEAASKPAPPAPVAAAAAPPPGDAFSVQPTFVAPPRTTADINAILEREKPDAEKIAARKAQADAAPPAGAAPAAVSQFYYDRAAARALLGRNQDALADALQALDAAKSSGEFGRLTRVSQLVGLRYRALGDPKKEMETFESIVSAAAARDKRGAMINPLADLARTALSMGEISQGEAYARRAEALVQEARGSPNPIWRKSYAVYGQSWEADAAGVSALAEESHGQYAEAEAGYRRAEAFRRASVNQLPNYDYPVPREQILQAAETSLLSIARTVSKQGRLSEAEAIARKALLDILDQQGRFSPATPAFIVGLAGIVVEEGRYKEAEDLAQSALDTQRTLGVADDSPETASILSSLGNILILQGKAKQAQAVFTQLDEATKNWPASRRDPYQSNGSRVAVLYAAGQVEAGVALAEEYVKRETTRKGANSFDAALARGLLAFGYSRSNRSVDALREFKAAIPVMMTAAREGAADDDPTIVAAKQARLQRIVEAYFNTLIDQAKDPNDVADETFALADAIRGHAVGHSLADASARLSAKDPALAELVRGEQDLSKQIEASLGAINNLLSLPPDGQRDQDVSAASAAVAELRTKHDAAVREIAKRYPAYASLMNPKPPALPDIKAALRPGEALLSFYFGRTASFVWAASKQGAVAFARIPMKASELEATVRDLRKALEPEATRVEDIPPFDVAKAYSLYAALLSPVENGWKDAKSLVVVTNGALGELPLGLLPTANVEVDAQAQPLFAGYRDVPWLARTHNVIVVPSASAFLTLRSLPAGSSNRENLIGFGDPYFSPEEAAEAEAEAAKTADAAVSDTSGDADVTRGRPLKLRAVPHVENVDKAELAMLPRLPDTRQELTDMARALDVDPAKSLYLGKDANERNVETLDLTRYRVVAFATHGLIPGDLDGLTQPALALTAPEVAGVEGDGLLTTEKILALKLDADWVVLSACNTGAGAGAGAEAASGLGSAFFYAGTRALLVTNWSVQSTSARELTSDLFRRQSADPNLSRGEALRQSMMALIDGPGSVDAAGHTVYAYAHPLFWAPFTVIGDGGGN